MTLILILPVILICVAAIILGAIGLVQSIRRPRTVKGIVFSAVGLSSGIAGLIFVLISIFFNGMFSTIFEAASKM